MQNSSNGAAGASLAQKQLHPIPSPNGPVSSGQSIPHQPSDWSRRPATSPLSKARLSQHPVSSSANNHALNAPNPLLDPRVPSGVDNSQRPRSDILGVRTSSENTAVSIFSMYVDHDTVPDAPESVSAPHGSRLSSGNHAVRPPSRILDRLASTLRSSVESSKTPSDRPQSQNSTAGLAYLDGISGTELLSFKSLHSPQISDTLPISSTSANFESAVTIAINGPQTPTSDDGDSFFCPPFPSIPSHSTTAKGPMMRPSSRSSRVKSQDAQASISSPDILASQESGSWPRLSSTSARPSSSTSDPRHPSSSSIHGHIDSTNLYAGAPTTTFTHLSPDKGSATASAKSASILSQPPSHRGADEEADAEYVRNVYARFDALGGVPGDGFEEGVERTRARLPSAVGVTYSDEVGVVKGANISEREEQRLRNVDRYGFFTDSKSSHHDSRLTLLPTAPFTRRIKRLSPSAPPTAANQSPNPPEFRVIPPPKPPTREATRLDKWNKMMRPKKRGPGENVETWTPDGQGTTPEKFRQRVWKGISDRWRPAAWQLLIDRRAASAKGLLQAAKLESHYRESIDVPSKHDVQIDLDVPRTVNNHILFHTRYGQGQRSLFHILHCFSLQCSTCEYCQGMGSIAATFLFYLDPERSYVSLVRLHDAYNMHSIFSPGFPGLLENIYVQERLLETLMPGVYQSFKNNVVSSTSYATKWYITLFTNSFPHQMQLRIWDVFLLEGQDIIVLFGIAIIWALKDYLASPQASFESILSLVSSFFVPEDEDAVVSWVHKLSETKGLRSSMSVWRTDWRALVASGKDRTALI